MNDLEQRVPVGVTNIAKLMPNPEALLTIPQNERNPGGLIDVRIENLRRQLREKYKCRPSISIKNSKAIRKISRNCHKSIW